MTFNDKISYNFAKVMALALQLSINELHFLHWKISKLIIASYNKMFDIFFHYSLWYIHEAK